MTFDTPSLLWLFAAAVLVSYGWRFGKRLERWVAGIAEWLDDGGYSLFRRNVHCRLGKHRLTEGWSPKDGSHAEAQWWNRVTDCPDCKANRVTREVHRAEVPDSEKHYVTFSFGGFYPFGHRHEDGEEWKGE